MVAKLVGVLLYLAVLVGIGAVASRRMKDVRDYFAGSKQLGYLAAAFSARATGESAWLLLGLTGMGAAVGVKAFWVVLGEVLGVGAAWLLLSRRFWRLTQRYDAITVPDYLEARFADHAQLLRKVSAAALVVFIAIYVSAQIDATGKAFEGFLGWNYYAGAITGFVVVLAYITSGGFLAVVWSDVFQGALMVLGLAVLPVVGFVAAGGPDAVFGALRAADPALMAPLGAQGATLMGLASALGLALIGLGFLGSPQIFVRFLALRDESEIGRGTAVALAWTLIADSGAVLIGMVARAMLVGPGESIASAMGDAERALPLLVEHLLPAGLVGLYIAIVLSAIMSTVDSLLVLAGSAAVRDWYQKIRHPDLPDDQLVRASRLATFGLACAALAIALAVAATTPDRTVFWFVVFGWSGIAATFCPTMILSLYWRGMTARGALASMVSGFLCVPLFKFGVMKLAGVGPVFSELGELPPAFAVAAVAGIVVSLLDRSGRDALTDAAAHLEDAAR